MNTVSVASLNCQGLRNAHKRRDVFHYLKQKDFSIYCLQDTHFDEKLEKYISSEWGYVSYFSSYKSNARGVCILFNNNFEFKVKRVQRDKDGNVLMILFKTMEHDILLVNVYGPNKDMPEFYEQLENQIRSFKTHYVIAVGDWNLVLDPTIDYDSYKHVNNPKSQEKVQSMTENLGLADIWREYNPETRRYTWRKTSPLKQSRLDFFLLSEYLIFAVEEPDIQYGYRSDHSMVTLRLKFSKENIRKTYWKFNSSLLRDDQFVQEIHEVIEDTIQEYAAPHYHKADIRHFPYSEVELTIADNVFLDFLLMKIRSKTISYASWKKKSANEDEEKIEREIGIIEKYEQKTENDVQKLQMLNEELKLLRQKKIEGVLLRSKARWVDNGEKISKYFCNLEKRHYINKHISHLTTSKGEILNDSCEIMTEIKVL